MAVARRVRVAAFRSDGLIQISDTSGLETEGGLVELLSPEVDIAGAIDTGGEDFTIQDATQITLAAEAQTHGGDVSFIATGGGIDIQAPIRTEASTPSLVTAV